MRYFYFVSYSHTFRGVSGWGNSEISNDNPIRDYAAIGRVEAAIARKNGQPANTVVLINYILLRTEVKE